MFFEKEGHRSCIPSSLPCCTSIGLITFVYYSALISLTSLPHLLYFPLPYIALHSGINLIYIIYINLIYIYICHALPSQVISCLVPHVMSFFSHVSCLLTCLKTHVVLSLSHSLFYVMWSHIMSLGSCLMSFSSILMSHASCIVSRHAVSCHVSSLMSCLIVLHLILLSCKRLNIILLDRGFIVLCQERLCLQEALYKITVTFPLHLSGAPLISLSRSTALDLIWFG